MNQVRVWSPADKPRWYQLEALAALARDDIQYAILRWHRRAGKDWTAWLWLVNEAMKVRCNCSYFFPTRVLGRQVIWEGVDPKTGGGFLQGTNKALIRTQRADELYVELINGSTIRILGTDTSDVVGPNPYRCVFSEYALQNPTGWNHVRPILEANKGKAVFTSTPRGMNHFYDLWNGAIKSPKWFCSEKTVYHTGVISDLQIQEMLDEGVTLDHILQEYFVSWNAGLRFAYWEKEMRAAHESGRINPGVKRIEGQPVYAAWDIGNDDHTAIWLFQVVSGKLYFFDYYDNTQQRLETNLASMHERTDRLDGICLPWDARKRDSDGHTTLEMRMQALGYNIIMVPRCSRIQDDIELVRRMFGDAYLNQETCKKGLYCLSAYRPDYDEKSRTFSPKPKRDYAAHGASAFRYALRAVELGLVREAQFVKTEKDSFDRSWGGRVNVRDDGGTASPHGHILRRIRGPMI